MAKLGNAVIGRIKDITKDMIFGLERTAFAMVAKAREMILPSLFSTSRR
jgi:hypothetical protein